MSLVTVGVHAVGNTTDEQSVAWLTNRRTLHRARSALPTLVPAAYGWFPTGACGRPAFSSLPLRGGSTFSVFLFSNVGNDSEDPETLQYVEQYGAAHGIQLIELRRTRRGGSNETLRGRLTRPGSWSLPIPVSCPRGDVARDRRCTMTASSPDAGNSDRVNLVRHREHLSPGRPHRLSVRLSDDERHLVDLAAREAHLTPAGYAGKATVAAASRDVAPSAGFADGPKELQRELFAARRAVNMFASNVNQAPAAYNSTGELPDWTSDAVQLCRAAVARLDEVTGRIDRRLR